MRAMLRHLRTTSWRHLLHQLPLLLQHPNRLLHPWRQHQQLPPLLRQLLLHHLVVVSLHPLLLICSPRIWDMTFLAFRELDQVDASLPQMYVNSNQLLPPKHQQQQMQHLHKLPWPLHNLFRVLDTPIILFQSRRRKWHPALHNRSETFLITI
mmetsp:Transcript_78378/g.227471  ORF Transcript_78378/g.227471 Transcript_78378/m.227471 type:complete len:153 (-) Transcript_78378:634-1092(-)